MGQTRAYMELKSIPDALRRLRGAPRQPTGGNRATAGQSKLSSPPQGAEMEEVGAAGSYHHGGDGGVAVLGDGNRAGSRPRPAWSGETHALVTAANSTQIS